MELSGTVYLAGPNNSIVKRSSYVGEYISLKRSYAKVDMLEFPICSKMNYVNTKLYLYSEVYI